MKMLFLIDGDNNITTGLNGIQHLTEEDTVLVFHSQGMALSKIRARCATSRAKVSFIESVKDGKNSVDFQIVAELGVRIGKNDVQFAYIISQDQGYVPSITMLKKCYGDLFCEIGLADSVESCLNLTFLLRTRSRLELYTSLCHEYGDAKGDLVFNHLKELFEMPEVNFAPAPVREEPAVIAAEPVPEETPEPAEEPEPEPEPVFPENPMTETEPEPEPVPEETAHEPEDTEIPEPEITEPVPDAIPESEAVSEPETVPVPEEKPAEEIHPEPKAEPKPFMTTPKTFVVASGAVIPGGAISSSVKAEQKPDPEPMAEPELKPEPEAPKAEEPKPVKKPQPRKAAKPSEKAAEEPVKAEEKAEPEKPAKSSGRRSSAKKKAKEVPAPEAQPAPAEPAKEADKPSEAPKAEAPAPEMSSEAVSDDAPAARNHKMKLYAVPFEKILAGKKSVEVRCNDTKRQKLRVGDTITFEKQTNEGGTLTVRVTSLDTYPTFEELIEAKGLTVLGCEPEDTAESFLKKLFRIYGKRQVQTYGTVAIGIELIP